MDQNIVDDCVSVKDFDFIFVIHGSVEVVCEQIITNNKNKQDSIDQFNTIKSESNLNKSFKSPKKLQSEK